MADDTERVIGVVREQGIDYDSDGEAIPWTEVYVKVKVAFRQKALKLLKGPRLSCFLCVALHVGDEGTAHPSIDTIMRETGYSRSIVCNALDELEKLGFIEKQRRKHDSTLYHIKGYVWFGSDSKPTLLGEAQSSKSELPESKSRGSKRLESKRLPNEPKDDPSSKDKPITAKDNLDSGSKKSNPETPAPSPADGVVIPEVEHGHDTGVDTSGSNPAAHGHDAGASHGAAEKVEMSPDMWDLARRTASARAQGGNYADPAQAGGDDAIAETALACYCKMQGEKPTDRERDSMVSEFAETLKPLKPTREEVELAFKIMAKDFSYRVGNYNPFQDSFKRDLATCIRRARGQASAKAAARHDRYARDAEMTEASLAALDERLASRPPLVKDDRIGIAVKLQLEVQMTKATYDVYVRPCAFTCDDGALVVTAPDASTRDWGESHLGDIVKRMLPGFGDGLREVRFEMGGKR